MVGNKGNSDPWHARLTHQTQQREGASEDLEAALLLLRLCVTRNTEVLLREPVPDEAVFRASHASSQLASAVAKVLSALETQGRLEALELRLSHVRLKAVK